MMKWDLTLERHIRIMKKEEREEGRQEGDIVRLLRLIQRKVSRGKSLTEVAEDLEDTEEAIRPLYDAVQKYGADCTAEEIYGKAFGN